MRVNINTTEQTTGLLRKKTYYNIGCKVEFTEEEKAIIKKSKLEDRIFMDGQPIKGLEHLPVHVYIKTLIRKRRVWRIVRDPDGGQTVRGET